VEQDAQEESQGMLGEFVEYIKVGMMAPFQVQPVTFCTLVLCTLVLEHLEHLCVPIGRNFRDSRRQIPLTASRVAHLHARSEIGATAPSLQGYHKTGAVKRYDWVSELTSSIIADHDAILCLGASRQSLRHFKRMRHHTKVKVSLCFDCWKAAYFDINLLLGVIRAGLQSV
jgi:hypothetical protein